MSISCALLFAALAPGIVSPVPTLDMDALDVATGASAARLLIELACDCGCGHSLDRCLRSDPHCPHVSGTAQALVDALAAGQSPAEAAASRPAGPSLVLSRRVHSLGLADVPVWGPDDALVTVVVFGDFACDWTALAQSWLRELVAAHPSTVRVAFKHMPSTVHPHSGIAAEAAVFAHRQGRFWALADAMFGHLQELTPDHIGQWAVDLGLDRDQLYRAHRSGQLAKRVAADVAEGRHAGVATTPTFFINGRRLVPRANRNVLLQTVAATIQTEAASADAARPED